MVKKKLRKRGSYKWKDDFYVDAFVLARSGLSDTKIAESIGVSNKCFILWKRDRPALRRALDRGRYPKKSGDPAKEFEHFVFNRLPEHLQELWNEIEQCENGRTRLERAEAIFDMAGKRVRQRLFLHALACTNFNITEACRKVNIQRQTYRGWCANEKEFAELMEEVHQAKKDYIEAPLLDLIKARDTKAVIFANKTFNKDRGYGEKVTVEQTGTVEHKHHLVNLDELNLAFDVKLKILEAIQRKEQKGIEDQSEIVEAEYEKETEEAAQME